MRKKLGLKKESESLAESLEEYQQSEKEIKKKFEAITQGKIHPHMTWLKRVLDNFPSPEATDKEVLSKGWKRVYPTKDKSGHWLANI